MASKLDDDGSEDVNDFLKRIKELGDQRDREDAERTRKLEEDILQGRKERQARREERARSLSPIKNSTSTSSLSNSTRSRISTNEAPQQDTVPTLPIPQDRSLQAEVPQRRMEQLSLSGNAEPGDNASPVTSRDSIAQSLASKSPAWFRQTQERGEGSAALRKSSTQDQANPAPTGSNVGLPGMAKNSSAASDSPTSSGRAHSVASNISNPGGSASSISGSSRSAFPTSSSQTLNPTKAATASPDESRPKDQQGTAMSPFQRNISPERVQRPSSPTKGLGGFVQSAMMKRSDSVSKRWSAQPTARLGRAESISSNRGQFEPVKASYGGIGSLGEPKPARFSRESTPASRPTSSQSSATITPNMRENGSFDKAILTDGSTPDSVSGTQSQATSFDSESRPSSKDSNTHIITSPPSSPSKRWSPQKPSWLEKAINKPESPKVFSPPPAPQQPSWMAEIARAKQQRGSVDLTKGSSHKEVTTSGLMRAPPPAAGYKSPTIGGTTRGLVSNNGRQFGSSDDLKVLSEPQKIGTAGLPQSKSLGQMPSRNDACSESNEETAVSSKIADHEPGPKPNPPLVEEAFERPSRSSAPNPPKPTIKPKPIVTPHKRDLANRREQGGDIEGPEPEFKNVFSKLKPTKTQNYKAPDELKDNITRGKAGLVLTGGPQKSERKDEFLDSILKKKQGMVLPSTSTRISSAAMANPSTTLPEALQRRQGLKRSDSQIDAPKQQPKQPTSASQDHRLQPSTGPTTEKSKPPVALKPKQEPGLGINFASSLSGILQRGPPKPVTEAQDSKDSRSKTLFTEQKSSTTSQEAPSTGPQLTHTTKSRARGPKRKPPTSSKESPKEPSGPSDSPPIPTPMATTSTAPSPKPKSIATEPMESGSEIKVTSQRLPTRPLQNITNSMNNNRRTSQPASPRKPSTSVMHSPKIQDGPIQNKPYGQEAPTTPLSSNKISKPANNLTPSRNSALESTPRDSTSAVKKAIQPSPLPKPDTAIFNEPAKPKQSPTMAKGLHSPPLPQKPTFFQSPVTATPSQSPRSARLPPSTSPPRLDVTQLLLNIFDEGASSRDRPNFNTQAVLDSATSQESFPKIKTLRKQIFEVTDNGKTVPVPSQHEHFLFENSLYLCIHVFGTTAGQRMTEVYLWCGDGASPSAVEDAQLFAKRFAKDSGGRLIVIQQGKETSSFFQALGGIVISRRGRAPPSPTSQYILRGRQHIGQVAFDEVDYAPNSLCSGFPHIISSGASPLYLWKGKGASADEVGCARLIGMDLGAVEEIDEGSESAAFWKILPSTPLHVKDSPKPYWSSKPQHESYGLRLFRVETEQARPKSASSFMSWGRRGSAPSPERQVSPNAVIKEVVPYSWADIEEGVLVLDTFFEVFVIHTISSLSPAPHRRSRQSAAFRAACLFAQEYAILAASAEDRPGVPQASVAFLLNESEERSDDVPEGLRTAFRKWEGEKWKGCRCLTVTEVLAGLGASREG